MLYPVSSGLRPVSSSFPPPAVRRTGQESGLWLPDTQPTSPSCRTWGRVFFILLASILFCSLTDPANALSPAAQNAVRAVHGYWKKILDTRISFASTIMQYIVVSFLFLNPCSVMANINKIETDMGILYINTVGFMENIPEYIYDNHPPCKNFLKIDWVKKSNYEEIWIGLFIIDVYKDNTNEQREFIILQKWGDSKGYKFYDITLSKYRGKVIRNLLNESDNVTGFLITEEDNDILEKGMMIIKNGEKIFIKKGCDGAYSLKYGLHIPSLGIRDKNTLPVDQRICIINPDEQERTSAP